MGTFEIAGCSAHGFARLDDAGQERRRRLPGNAQATPGALYVHSPAHGEGCQGSVVEGLESGADDYLTKPFHPQELRARIRVGLRLLDLEDNLVQAREAMRFKATHDALTGVWNRGAIMETLDREITRSHREGASLGVLIADLDHFKAVNDTYGHAAGDCVLREVTMRMQRDVRAYDAVGRYGGEEFLILLPGCNRSENGEQSRTSPRNDSSAARRDRVRPAQDHHERGWSCD